MRPVGRLVGYARVSTEGQTLEQQFAVLRDAGCDEVFGEKVSSTVWPKCENVDNTVWPPCENVSSTVCSTYENVGSTV